MFQVLSTNALVQYRKLRFACYGAVPLVNIAGYYITVMVYKCLSVNADVMLALSLFTTNSICSAMTLFVLTKIICAVVSCYHT